MKVTKMRSSCRSAVKKTNELVRFGLASLALGAMVGGGCVVPSRGEEADPVFTAPGSPDDETLTEGNDPADFCDDGNPCTTDANCTPCSTLPAVQRDIYRCTADDELPAFCIGRSGCVHVERTTPAGQVNDCFPVGDASDPRAGVCRAGRCADDAE